MCQLAAEGIGIRSENHVEAIVMGLEKFYPAVDDFKIATGVNVQDIGPVDAAGGPRQCASRPGADGAPEISTLIRNRIVPFKTFDFGAPVDRHHVPVESEQAMLHGFDISHRPEQRVDVFDALATGDDVPLKRRHDKRALRVYLAVL